MSNQLDLKQEIKEGKSKFKTLSFGQKLTYIKDYYSLHILVTIIIIITGFAIYKTYEAKNFNTVLYVALVNNDKSVWSEDDDSYETRLSNPYAASIGIDNDKDRIIIDNNYLIDYNRDSEMSVYSAESLVAMIYAANLDILIGNELSLDYFCEDEYTFFHPLNVIFEEEFLNKHQDRIVYHTYTNGTKVPVAFDVTSCKFIEDAGLTLAPVYVSVLENTNRLDAATDYIRYILESK